MLPNQQLRPILTLADQLQVVGHNGVSPHGMSGGEIMRRQRVWIEILVVGSAVALALALFLATIGLAAGLGESSQGPQESHSVIRENAKPASEHSFEGMVTCSRCGAKHSPALERPATVCVRVCVHGGAKFALVGADSNYVLDGDPQALKRVAGQRARVVGYLRGNTIQVRSVAAES